MVQGILNLEHYSERYGHQEIGHFFLNKFSPGDWLFNGGKHFECRAVFSEFCAEQIWENLYWSGGLIKIVREISSFPVFSGPIELGYLSYGGREFEKI